MGTLHLEGILDAFRYPKPNYGRNTYHPRHNHPNAPLAGINWFRTGGNAGVLTNPPAFIDDLRSFLTELKPQIPITVLGLGSNSLIRDGGVPGIVIHLGKNFNEINFDGEDILAGAGEHWMSRFRVLAATTPLPDLNFLPGFRGQSVAPRMNAGAYGREIADILISAKALIVAAKYMNYQQKSLDCLPAHRD